MTQKTNHHHHHHHHHLFIYSRLKSEIAKLKLIKAYLKKKIKKLFTMSIINFRLHKRTNHIFYKIRAEKPPPPHRGPGRRPAPGDSTHAARAPLTQTPTTAASARETTDEPPQPAPTSGHTENQEGPQHECLHVASPPSPIGPPVDAKREKPRTTPTTTATQHPHHEEEPAQRASIPVVNERVNEYLDSLRTWLAANKLSLNVAKTHSLIIGCGQKLKNIQQATAVKPSLVIGREIISMIKDTKYLGVYVDQHLSWDVQIANMVKKISKALGMLRYSNNTSQ